MYAKVIKEVCEQSQVDFEEGGVDQSTLEMLKTVGGLSLFLVSTSGFGRDLLKFWSYPRADSECSTRLSPLKSMFASSNLPFGVGGGWPTTEVDSELARGGIGGL